MLPASQKSEQDKYSISLGTIRLILQNDTSNLLVACEGVNNVVFSRTEKIWHGGSINIAIICFKTNILSSVNLSKVFGWPLQNVLFMGGNTSAKFGTRRRTTLQKRKKYLSSVTVVGCSITVMTAIVFVQVWGTLGEWNEQDNQWSWWKIAFIQVYCHVCAV